jgi:aminomethyltransferase
MNQPTTAADLLHTPFHKFHIEHGATMVEFAGWEMPIMYRSIIEEHKQVRSSGGFFDVSHMGRLRFAGRHARKFLDRVCTRQIMGMQVGQCRYSLVCNEQGGCRDDVLVYCMDEDEYLMVCNASNRLKLLEHFAAVRGDMVFQLKDETAKTAMVAVQGPKVMDLVAKFSKEIPTLKRYRFVKKNLLLLHLVVSRTGYTGEDGIEVIMEAGMARQAMKLILKDMGEADAAVKPIGLGARDSLRLEAGMPLYGHEIEEHLDPISAGLNFAVKLDKGADDERVGGFIGQDALQRIATDGPRQRLVGLKLDTRRAARQNMLVKEGDIQIGFVTSGCISPTLDASIAMAYVAAGKHETGSMVQVDLGKQVVRAEIVPLPFYKAT